ncbi:MAG: hypothetical protein ABEJ77_07620 [Halanaeroarchaeum sp.]
MEVLLPLGYRNAAELSVRRWALAAVRVIGVLYLLVAVGLLPREADR